MNDVPFENDSAGAAPEPRGWIVHARNLGIFVVILIIVARYSSLGATPQKRAEQEINAQLSGAFALKMPVGTTVIHATFRKSDDPINFFELKLPSGQTGPFVDSISTQASKSYRVTRDASNLTGSTAFGRTTPVWWRKGMPSDEMFLELQATDGSSAFLLFSSPSVDRIFLCWLEF